MEKRVIGIILTVLGIIGLIVGAMQFVQHSSGVYNIKLITMYAVLGAVFFFAGIGLIRSTRDLPQ